MIVLLDVGNSRIKLGWHHPTMGREAAVHAMALSPLTQLPDALRKWLSTLPVQPREARGVNVAGHVVAQLIEQALAEAGCPIQWVLPTTEHLGVRNTYDKPSQLGADRWAALLGLAGHFPDIQVPLVLATFGTATTIDTLSPDKVFKGGLILPGPALMRQSLAQGTANLPLASGATTEYPTHTLQAIATGVVAAQAGAFWSRPYPLCQWWGLARGRGRSASYACWLKNRIYRQPCARWTRAHGLTCHFQPSESSHVTTTATRTYTPHRQPSP